MPERTAPAGPATSTVLTENRADLAAADAAGIDAPGVPAPTTAPGPARPAVSCGTLVINPRGEILLCHVTNTDKWDIPKGMQDASETPLEAAIREMREEAGIAFPSALFVDLGSFAYRSDKRLHLFRLQAPPEFDDLSHLQCTSFFPHHRTGKPVPEVDGFRWAQRTQVGALCWPRMAKQLLALQW